MVQYILTPWRDRQELLLVRSQFYGSSKDKGDNAGVGAHKTPRENHDHDHEDDASHDNGRSSEIRRRRRLHQAVARVSMWMQRGNCPHMVESTGLLTAAVLSDEEAAGDEDGRAASSAYAARAAYSAAFSRFVTGLLDGQQDKLRKQSMYSLAKNIGLPATFVELRHQATHEQLPSLAKLRSATRKSLQWIWEYYWQHLGPEDESQSNEVSGTPCEAALLRYLTHDQDEKDHDESLRVLKRTWDRQELMSTLAQLQGRLPGNQAQIKCLRLSKELTTSSGNDDDSLETSQESGEADNQASKKAATVPSANNADFDTGWDLCAGLWKPKPIGMI